ncbi:Uma2 family endonuclease [Phytomonospora endophytica]|uniref:Uma2 family endonuclease n=1 Tax=Phytomonospora endophytica TaxID=714109 RepID=A0A841FUY4_9ACTN|nr:Uma2 family endonuclease [Phytomonospora endophytica]MBB6037528.1 Uma2 family endonuclease [Phytomonospora endophytica]GIG70780.1 hypothetical protein Pen01_70750 [Phytomonospora endophytica]
MTATPPFYHPSSEWNPATDHSGPWTEEDYEALPEGLRAELHDGSLILTPSPAPLHDLISRRLANLFAELLQDDELVHTAMDLRMADGRRFRTPDVMVLRAPAEIRPVPPGDVELVVEVLSPGGGCEWDTKMQVYAAAGIPAYLILEEKGGVVSGWHHELVNGKYALTAEAHDGEELFVVKPFTFTIDLTALALRKRRYG